MEETATKRGKKRGADPDAEPKTKRPIDPESPRGQLLAFGRAERQHSAQLAKVDALKAELIAAETELTGFAKAKEEAAEKLKTRL